MTREEALAFLELPVTATPEEIKTRIADKLEFFETQSEKAPSDFLRRLALRNLGLVKTILKDAAPWISITKAPEPEPVLQEAADEQPEQTVYIVSSMKEAVLKKAAEAELPKKRAAHEPAAWLIKHTEQQPASVYPIMPGKNFLGRKKQAALEPFVVIDGDDFISRLQCVLYAEEDNPLEFFISDPAAFNNGKASKNGSYVNGVAEPISEKKLLHDGDTIQVGATKLVIRFNTGVELETVKQEVENSGYISTVVS